MHIHGVPKYNGKRNTTKQNLTETGCRQAGRQEVTRQERVCYEGSRGMLSVQSSCTSCLELVTLEPREACKLLGAACNSVLSICSSLTITSTTAMLTSCWPCSLNKLPHNTRHRQQSIIGRHLTNIWHFQGKNKFNVFSRTLMKSAVFSKTNEHILRAWWSLALFSNMFLYSSLFTINMVASKRSRKRQQPN